MYSRSKFFPNHQTCGSREKAKLLTTLSAASACALAHAAPITISGAGSTSQDFDALPNSGTPTWVDDATLPGWYSQRSGTGTTIVADNGSGTTGGLYSFGTTSSTERALGSIGSGTPDDLAHGVLLQNTSGNVATINSLAYTGEQWRKSGTTTAQSINLSYQVSSTPVTALSPGSNTGWIAVPSGDFSSPVFTSGGAALDGNAIANKALVAVDPSIVIPDGSYVMIRWSDVDHTGSDHGLAIDDVTLGWVTGSPPQLELSALPDSFPENEGSEASVGKVTIPSALGSDLTVSLTSSDTGEATVPATVTITAGQTEKEFFISATNDFFADGTQPVTITANASGYVFSQLPISVQDDTDAPIGVSVSPITFAETAGAGVATGTVTIAENTVSDLTINLSSNDISEATVPATAIIAAGTNSITFPVDAVDDIILDGTRNVTISAATSGYSSGNTVIMVTDDGDTPTPPTLNPGEIAFVGYNGDGDDDLGFVALVSIAAGEIIRFSDNEWNGLAIGSGGEFIDTNEGVISWTAPPGGVAAGTVVRLNSLSNSSARSASVGTVSSSGSFNLTASSETVYAYQGATTIPSGFVAVVANWASDSTANTGLSGSDIILLPTSADIAAYTGSRSNQTTYAAYRSLLADTATNWASQDASGDQHNDSITPDVPFSSTPFIFAVSGGDFSSWISDFTVGGLTGVNDDFDNDGLDNAVENILGSDPSVSNQGFTDVSGNSGSITFRHTRSASPAIDLTPSYEWSAGLGTWVPDGATDGGVTVTFGTPSVVAAGPPEVVEVTATATGGPAVLFVRLKVTNP